MKKILCVLSLCFFASCYLFWKFHAVVPVNTSEVLETNVCHLGIIMDGNRRWARQRGLVPQFGHKQGVGPFEMAIKFCLKQRIPYLTVYAFSLENFKRSPQELDFLFNTLAQELASKELDKLVKQGVCVRFVGDHLLFPSQLIPLINDIEEKTKEGDKLVLTLLFCYGGQQEIVEAARLIARAVESGKLKPEEITQGTFNQFLWMGKVPPPDLIIRTGNRNRLSNFLTYQSAYSELYFLDLYWPDITEEHLKQALRTFAQRERTFGN